MTNNNDNKERVIRVVAACFLVAIVIVIVGFRAAYAYFELPADGETTETKIQTGTADIQTSLTSVSAIDASNLQLIETSDIATAPSLNFTVKGKSGNKFNIYLKDIAISTGLINSAFKWEVLMDGVSIATGDFSDIQTNGVVDTSKTSTAETKYFSKYALKNNISFNGNNTSNIVVRVYLLNDPANDQSALLNGTFENKVAVEAFK